MKLCYALGMASSQDSGRVVHRQKFQNANQIVEVLVRTKPKLPYSSAPVASGKKFKRECLLEKEIERISKEQNVPEKDDGNLQRSKKYGRGSDKINPKESHMVLEVSKRKGHSRKKKHAPDNANLTWREILRNNSSIKADDSFSSGASNDAGISHILSNDLLYNNQPNSKSNKSVQTSKFLGENPLNGSDNTYGPQRRDYREESSSNKNNNDGKSRQVPDRHNARRKQLPKNKPQLPVREVSTNTSVNIPAVNQVS